jgi:hypothetical protein
VLLGWKFDIKTGQLPVRLLTIFANEEYTLIRLGGTKTRRGPPAAMSEADVRQHNWGDGAAPPCMDHHAAERFNAHIIAGLVRCSKLCVNSNPRNLGGGGGDAPRSTQITRLAVLVCACVGLFIS